MLKHNMYLPIIIILTFKFKWRSWYIENGWYLNMLKTVYKKILILFLEIKYNWIFMRQFLPELGLYF